MSDNVRPDGCSCPGDHWLGVTEVGPTCDAFDWDGQGECLRCEHFEPCHMAKMSPERRVEAEKLHDRIREDMFRAFGVERSKLEGTKG